MQKLQFTYVQATGKAFRPQKKNIQHFQKMKFINNFLCLWLIFSFWIRNRNPDPGTPLNPDPQQWLSMFHLAASTWCCSWWWKERQRQHVRYLSCWGCCCRGKEQQQRLHVRYFSSILFAFDVLPGRVHRILLTLVEGATKTACPIPLFNSLNLRNSLNPDLDTDPVWIQSFDDQKFNKKIQIWSKIAIHLCQSYRRSLPPSKENMQHFKKWNLWTFFYICR